MSLETYPKILIVSDAAWADDNNIGNTFSNLFQGWPKEKIAMIYARPNLPNTVVCDNFFQISETRLIKNIFNKKIKTGINLRNFNSITSYGEISTVQNDERSGKVLYSFFLKYRWNIFLTAREILWRIGDWKTSDLNKFLDDYNPEIVLSLADSSVYMNKIQQHVIKRMNPKSIIYFVDDVYSNKRFNLSPLYWINRLNIRKQIRNTVSMCDLVYTIIDKQKKEYDSYFEVDSSILNKGGEFGENPIIQNLENDLIKLIYTGNITSGRWQTLAKIGEALDKINENQPKASLMIYTRNQLYGNIEKAFKEIKSIDFKGSIEANQVKAVQDRADILVHVESLKLKEKLETRLSFSTKLVDYFERGKCILAVGWKEAASIAYLKDNEAAIVIDNIEEIEVILKEVLNHPSKIQNFADESWKLGKQNHKIEIIRDQFYNTLKSLVKDHNNENTPS